MSVCRIQDRIRKLKCPFSILLSPNMAAVDIFGDIARQVDAVCEIVPAVTVKTAPFFSLGAEGVAVLERVLRYARAAGLFVICDARLNEINDEQKLLAEAFLGDGHFSCDAVTVDAYLGSDVLLPLLEQCERNDRSIIVLGRRANGSAREVQDLILGERLVYRAIADLTARHGAKHMTDCGYSKVWLSLGLDHPSDLREMRRKYETTFFYITASPGFSGAHDYPPGFDRYGRGAVIEAELAPGEDAGVSLVEMRDALRRVMQIL